MAGADTPPTQRAEDTTAVDLCRASISKTLAVTKGGVQIRLLGAVPVSDEVVIHIVDQIDKLGLVLPEIL